MKKGKWGNRFMAYLLSLCMVVSVLCGTNMATVQAADSTTVYFLNTDGWTDIKAHAWNDSNSNLLGNWPGTDAVSAGEVGNNWWKVEVPAATGFSIMFTANGSETQRMTSYISDSQVYVTTVTDATYASAAEAEAAMGVVSSSDTTDVYFYNSKGWNTIYAYAYQNDAAIGTAYPGDLAISASEKGENWWKVTVPRNATTSPFNVIFNDGGDSNQVNAYFANQSDVYVTGNGSTTYSSATAAETAAGTGSGGNGEQGGSTGTGGGTNSDLEYDVELNGAGATVPYTVYEAEAATSNATVLSKSITYLTDIQSEASGRQAVKLANTGDYVEFTLTKDANAFVIRYNMPDSADGAGIDANLSLYIDGTDTKDIALTSKYAWIYGGYPYTNSPGDGKGHRFFDETRAFFGKTLSAGTKVKLQKDANDTAGYYIIDFMECELVEDAGTQPENSLSITDYGAVANDGNDDAAAMKSCIEAAKAAGKEVWIPAGTFKLSAKEAFNVEGVTIRGAGMWHSKLEGAGAAFKYQGTCKFYDFAMTGVATVRRDSEDLAGFEGVGAATNVTIQNIWMEHMKVGVWSYNTTNLVLQGCRIRNTYADGINLCSSTNNAVVRNNSLRNTGDDCIAIWPWQGDSCNNTVEYNTIQCPTLANGIAFYGGSGNKIQYNYVADTINNGSGICLGTDYDTPNGFTGTTTVENNILVRCGSYHCDYSYEVGAMWIWATKKPMTATFNIRNNTLYDCSYEGVLFDTWNTVSGVNFTDNNIYGANTNGVYVRGSSTGSATFNNLGVAEYGGQLLVNKGDNFTITQGENGIHETTIPKPIVTYTVTYILNNNTAMNSTANLTSYEAGTEVTLAEPTCEGYAFGGWYTTKDFAEGTEVTKLTMDADKIVYAKWTKNAEEGGSDNPEDNTEDTTTEENIEEKTENVTTENKTEEQKTEEKTEEKTENMTTESKTEEQKTEEKTEEKTENITTENKTEEQRTEEKTENATTENKTEEQRTEEKTENATTENKTEEQRTEEKTENVTAENKTEEQKTEEKTEEKTENVTTEVTSIQLNVKKKKLGVKEKFQLVAVINPTDATNTTVTYISSNPKIATVSHTGKVTAKKCGKVTITALTTNGIKATVKITVKKAPKYVKFKGKAKIIKLKKGRTLKLKTQLSKGSVGTLTFKSGNKKVVSVNNTGKIKALKKGKAVITVKTYNKKKATITVIVE